MEYEKALKIATKVKEQLAPHCYRIEIAGSIRRKKAEVNDIEIVAIAKTYDVGLFHSGIASIINGWVKIKGELPCKYTQRMLPEGIKLDIFFAEEHTWGMVYALRTGSARFSHKVLANSWVRKGFKSVGNYLWKGEYTRGFREEQELFDFLKIPFIEPENRN
ncbi:hypothetical protein H9I45_15315 [Polaribacter haliotis]|uniref:DNA polymerase beta thumb domain-containing protein n=1 Tax=Polaribacter haliotis TaxID=1888915 RepID=A0A7L8AFA5_9FLAO|nr:hypothetical protein [Polaribacter haliotis]QOD60688.1 hypothetical protein H9I45_15315 [Polaribacter haliotis]